MVLDPVRYHRAPLLQPWCLAPLKVDVLLGVWIRSLEFNVLSEVAEIGLELLDFLVLLLSTGIEGVFHLPALLDE